MFVDFLAPDSTVSSYYRSGHFVVIISCVAILFALVFFTIGITNIYKGKIGLTFTFAITILVAFVPEGLPSTVMLLLSIAAKRMAKQNVLVKDLQGVETLGVCHTLPDFANMINRLLGFRIGEYFDLR